MSPGGGALVFFFRVCCRGGGISPPFRQKFDNRFESDQMDSGFLILLFFTVFRELGDGQSRGRVEECGSFFDFSRLPAALRALLCLRSPRETAREVMVFPGFFLFSDLGRSH